MKYIGSLAVLGAVLAASAPFASATSYTVGSYCNTCATPAGYANTGVILASTFLTGSTDPGENPVAPVFTATPLPATFNLGTGGTWAGPIGISSWIGAFANAEPGGVNPPYGFYEFTTTFAATAGAYTLNLSALADDTVAVILDGTTIIKFPTTQTNDTECSNAPTGCLSGTETTLTNLPFTLGASNTITLIVEQSGSEAAGTDPSGVDFQGTFTSTVTPEPSSLVLLGTGLMSAAGVLVRKRRTV